MPRLTGRRIWPMAVVVSLGGVNLLVLGLLATSSPLSVILSAAAATLPQILAAAPWVFPDWHTWAHRRCKGGNTHACVPFHMRAWASALDYAIYGIGGLFASALVFDLFAGTQLVWGILALACVPVLVQDKYPRFGLGKRAMGLKCLSCATNSNDACTIGQSILRNGCLLVFILLTVFLAGPPAVSQDITVAYPYLWFLVFWLSQISVKNKYERTTLDIITQTMLVRPEPMRHKESNR